MIADTKHVFTSNEPFSLYLGHDPVIVNVPFTKGLTPTEIEDARHLRRFVCIRIKLTFKDPFSAKKPGQQVLDFSWRLTAWAFCPNTTTKAAALLWCRGGVRDTPGVSSLGSCSLPLGQRQINGLQRAVLGQFEYSQGIGAEEAWLMHS
jgi:hypothetical protein